MSNISISDRQSASEGQAGRGLGSTLVLAVGTFAVGTDAFVVAGFLPAMAGDLAVSTAAAGQSVTAFALAYAVLAPILATATAALPRRGLLVSALVLLGIANFLSAAAPDLPLLLASRVLAAAAAACYTPNAGAVSAALVRPELRGRALAVVIGGLTIATALGVPLGHVASQWLGWRAALSIVAGLSLAAAAGVFVFMPKLPCLPRVPIATRLAVARRPGVLAVLPLTILGMAACYTPYAYSVTVLEAVGVHAASVTLMLFLYGAGAVGGNFLSGVATDRWGATRFLGWAYGVMAATLALLGVLAWAGTDIPPATAVLVFAWGASSWAQSPAQQHRLIAAAPQEAPLVVALNSSAIYVGISLGTALGGATLEAGAATVFGIGALAAAGALAFLGMTWRVGAPR